MHRKYILPVMLSLVVVSAGWSYLLADESATMTDKVHTESVAPAESQPATNTEMDSGGVMQDESINEDNQAPSHDEELADTQSVMHTDVKDTAINHDVTAEHDSAVPQPAVGDSSVVVPHDQPTDVENGVVPKSDDSTKNVIKHDADVQCPAPAKVDEPATGVQHETGIHQDGTLAEADDQATIVPPADTIKKSDDTTKDDSQLPVCTETGQENCIAPSVVPAPAPTKEEDNLAQATETPVKEVVPAAPVAEPVAPPSTSAPSTIEQTGMSKEPGQAGLYMDRLKKFTVQFPETWEVKPGMAGMDVVGISPLEGPNDTFRENVNVASQVLQTPIKMEDFYTQGKKALSEQLPAFKELAVGDTNVNGLNVHWIEFSQASNNIQANIKQYYILSKDGSRAYIITGAAPPEKFDGFKATMEKIVQSFKAEN